MNFFGVQEKFVKIMSTELVSATIHEPLLHGLGGLGNTRPPRPSKEAVKKCLDDYNTCKNEAHTVYEECIEGDGTIVYEGENMTCEDYHDLLMEICVEKVKECRRKLFSTTPTQIPITKQPPSPIPLIVPQKNILSF